MTDNTSREKGIKKTLISFLYQKVIIWAIVIFIVSCVLYIILHNSHPKIVSIFAWLSAGCLVSIVLCFISYIKNNKPIFFSTFTSRNNSRVKKPFSKDLCVLCGTLVIIVLIFAFLHSEKMTENQAVIVGVAGATCISIVVMVITLNNEARKGYYTARKSSKVLSAILQSVYSQIERVQKGFVFPICYPDNWLEYYQDCALYLQYDYLDTLLQIFEMVNNLNSSIQLNDNSHIQHIIGKWKDLITDSTDDFCILSVMHNLEFFSMGETEEKPWKAQKSYLRFYSFFSEKYSDMVKKLSVEYLKNVNGHAQVKEVAYYVMNKLRKNSDLCDGEYKYNAIENKQVLHAIFSIFLSLNKQDPLSLCWGTLSINETRKKEASEKQETTT